MIPLTLAEIAAAVDGRVHGDGSVRVTGPVVTDSREAAPGALFVARAGEHQDGHDHLAGARAAGAVAALVEHEVAGDPGPVVQVADSEVALARLAREVLTRVAPTVVGVTGSSGKTTTKDLLATVLAGLGQVVAPPGSWNTDVGVPLTVLGADAGTRVVVAEMGARGIGHIARLTAVAPPDVAVVLNVGSAHLGEFGGRPQIAQAKSELVEGLTASGVAVLNADDDLVAAMADRAPGRVVTFGETAAADVRAAQVRMDASGHAGFLLLLPGAEPLPVTLAVVGEHQVANALAAAAVGYVLDVPAAEIADRLGRAQARSPWRMAVSRRADGLTVVNDAYNANPESVRAALRSLRAMAAGRRTWAVLGEMAELGETSTAEHDAVGRLAVRLDINHLVVVGQEARAVHLAAAHEGSYGLESRWVPDLDTARELLDREVGADDVVLVKASRRVGLERLAASLLGEDPR